MFRNLLLGSRGVLAVLPLFPSLHRMKCLSFSGNGLRDAAVQAIAATLGDLDKAPGLLVLDLSNNPIAGTNAVESLRSLLSRRRSVLCLGIAGTMLPDDRRKQILRQAVNNFSAADPYDALEAWRLTADGRNFADHGLRAQLEVAISNGETPLGSEECGLATSNQNEDLFSKAPSPASSPAPLTPARPPAPTVARLASSLPATPEPKPPQRPIQPAMQPAPPAGACPLMPTAVPKGAGHQVLELEPTAMGSATTAAAAAVATAGATVMARLSTTVVPTPPPSKPGPIAPRRPSGDPSSGARRRRPNSCGPGRPAELANTQNVPATVPQ